MSEAFICRTTSSREERSSKSRSFTFYLDRLQDIGLEFGTLEAFCTDGDIRPPYPYQWLAKTKLREGEDDPYEAVGGSPLEAVRNLYKQAKLLELHECCDGECYHDDCCGKVSGNCKNNCECHL